MLSYVKTQQTGNVPVQLGNICIAMLWVVHFGTMFALGDGAEWPVAIGEVTTVTTALLPNCNGFLCPGNTIAGLASFQ